MSESIKSYCENKNCTHRLCKYHLYNKVNSNYILLNLQGYEGCKRKGKNIKSIKVKVVKRRKQKRVLCVETNLIYESAELIAKKYNWNASNIRKCCNGKLKTAYGFTWKYVNSKEKQNDRNRNK